MLSEYIFLICNKEAVIGWETVLLGLFDNLMNCQSHKITFFFIINETFLFIQGSNFITANTIKRGLVFLFHP